MDSCCNEAYSRALRDAAGLLTAHINTLSWLVAGTKGVKQKTYSDALVTVRGIRDRLLALAENHTTNQAP